MDEPANARDEKGHSDDPVTEAVQGDESPGRRRKPKKKSSFWRELPILIGVALVLSILLQVFVARVYVIPSASMETTLHGCTGCTGDRILVDKVSYDFVDPSPGDVVVFHRPASWGNTEFQAAESGNFVATGLRKLGALVGMAEPSEDDFVKRIIAVGGQTVQCCDSQNRVIVDGKPLDEPYVYWRPDMAPTQEPFEPVTVPPGYLWVMGDNRNNSCDSRCQGGGGQNGLVPVGNVVGKAQVIVLPPGRWGGITDFDPQH
ncbi:signal peptidase I [Amycolatopsis sp.]|uniref:signal peptidase I n=1 Tax=Amycolatopsis sp. TaxID=37632 RepID=UPI0039C8A340